MHYEEVAPECRIYNLMNSETECVDCGYSYDRNKI